MIYKNLWNSTGIIQYADDAAIILQGKYPQTLCDLMENALTILSKWAENCGLGVNPDKQNLCYLQENIGYRN